VPPADVSGPETMRVERDGIGLHVEAQGPRDAAPVVFLHGVASSARTWGWLPDELKAGRRVILVDLRGHGRSDHAPDAYGIDDYGEDVAGLLRRVARRPAVLVGHSLGGVVAWWVAQQHPELVAAAFLEDPPLLAADRGGEPPAGAGVVFAALRAGAAADRQAGRSEDEVAARLASTPARADGRFTIGEIRAADSLAAMAFAHLRMDIRVLDCAIDGSTLAGVDTTSPVTPPVVVLAADDACAAAFSAADAERLARTHPAVRVERVPGSGHGIHDERRFREAFRTHLDRFLDVHAPRA